MILPDGLLHGIVEREFLFRGFPFVLSGVRALGFFLNSCSLLRGHACEGTLRGNFPPREAEFPSIQIPRLKFLRFLVAERHRAEDEYCDLLALVVRVDGGNISSLLVKKLPGELLVVSR